MSFPKTTTNANKKRSQKVNKNTKPSNKCKHRTYQQKAMPFGIAMSLFFFSVRWIACGVDCSENWKSTAVGRVE